MLWDLKYAYLTSHSLVSNVIPCQIWCKYLTTAFFHFTSPVHCAMVVIDYTFQYPIRATVPCWYFVLSNQLSLKEIKIWEKNILITVFKRIWQNNMKYSTYNSNLYSIYVFICLCLIYKMRRRICIKHYFLWGTGWKGLLWLLSVCIWMKWVYVTPII